MNQTTLFDAVKAHIQAIIKGESGDAMVLWQRFLALHPIDIADFFSELPRTESWHQVFNLLSLELRLEVFSELSDSLKAFCLRGATEQEKVSFLRALTVDELADLFDQISDEELKTYLNLLHKRDREKVISLLQFHPESTGGIMETEVLTLMQDFTVEKSIAMLQRLRPRREVHQQIYVTNKGNQLVGHINLEDLVLQQPKQRIAAFLRKNELVIEADQDQEIIAKQMVHYGLMSVPVVGVNNYFLGVIPSETLVDVLVEEASEDVQKMAALTPMKRTYFETPLFRLVYSRGYILIALLIAESFSGTILRAFEDTLQGVLMFFIPMLISAGGNTSSQTSAVVIQGMATGEIHPTTTMKFLRREMLVAGVLALMLAITAFIRVYISHRALFESLVVSTSLGAIVMLAVILGSCIPLILRRFNIDPAFSAGPFLATLMDILGILIYCYISKLFLF